MIDGASHDDDFFCFEKRLWVFCCSSCKISQRTNSDYRDGVFVIVAK